MLSLNTRLAYATALLFSALSVSPLLYAQCGCPSDGRDAPKALTGLGQAFPAATNRATDPTWKVYEFERDGIRYVQINDQMGVVRAAVGRIGATFWVMPIGTDVDSVSVPGQSLPKGQGRVLYRADDVEVLLYRDGNQQRWLVRPLALSR